LIGKSEKLEIEIKVEDKSTGHPVVGTYIQSLLYVSSFSNNGNGILQVSKMEGKLQCTQPAIARWRWRRRLPRRLCQFLQWNFHILFQLHCIKSFMHLSFSLYLALRAACCLLLPFANV
jgi:hypothetical protein